MRRRLGPLWPTLSELFSLHPWDVKRLTFIEIDGYEAAAEAYIAEMRRVSRGT